MYICSVTIFTIVCSRSFSLLAPITDTPPTSIAVTLCRIVGAVVVVATHGIQEPDAALGHAHHGIVAKAAAPTRFLPFNHPDLLLVQSNVLFAQVIDTLHRTAGWKKYKLVTFI